MNTDRLQRAGRPLAMALLLLGGWGCQAPESPAGAAQASDPRPVEHSAVLLRGWIGEAGADLEPVIPTAAAPSVIAGDQAPYRLRGLDDRGEVLFDLRFGEESLASIAGRPGHHFMLVAPVGTGGSLALAAVELDAAQGRTASRQARWSAAGLLDGLRGLRLATRDDGAVHVQWDAERFELLQLRDPAGGAILALDRDGEVTVTAVGGELEAALSDGVRSAATLLRSP